MPNLFDGLSSSPPPNLPEELVETLARGDQVRIERIVSTGHSSPVGFWYDQDEEEWVVLLAGEAGVRFEEDDTTVHLRPGDFIHIPAHRKHRVEWTSKETPTLWLAVFYSFS